MSTFINHHPVSDLAELLGDDRYRDVKQRCGGQPRGRVDITSATAGRTEAVHPRWDLVRESLGELLGNNSPDAQPAAIDAARHYALHLRDEMPGDPPTSVLPTPDGGVEMEFRFPDARLVYDFDPDGTGICDLFVRGRLLVSRDLPRLPDELDRLVFDAIDL